MGEQFINITNGNIDSEHICCAIADKGINAVWS